MVGDEAKTEKHTQAYFADIAVQFQNNKANIVIKQISQ